MVKIINAKTKLHGEEQQGFYDLGNDTGIHHDNYQQVKQEIEAARPNTAQILLTNNGTLRLIGQQSDSINTKKQEKEMNLDRYKLYILNHMTEIRHIILIIPKDCRSKDIERIQRFNKACKISTRVRELSKSGFI